MRRPRPAGDAGVSLVEVVLAVALLAAVGVGAARAVAVGDRVARSSSDTPTAPSAPVWQSLAVGRLRADVGGAAAAPQRLVAVDGASATLVDAADGRRLVIAIDGEAVRLTVHGADGAPRTTRHLEGLVRSGTWSLASPGVGPVPADVGPPLERVRALVLDLVLGVSAGPSTSHRLVVLLDGGRARP